MLIPRFSIRWVLLLTSVLSVVFVVVRQAFFEQKWAIATTAMLAFLALVFLAYGAMFVFAYWLAKATRTLNPPQKPTNPFIVDGQYPPQMIPKSTFGGEQE